MASAQRFVFAVLPIIKVSSMVRFLKCISPISYFLAKLTEQPQSRLGIVVAKKKVRRAHERNRVKRLARESFRLHQQQLTLDIVVMPKMGIEAVPNAELHQQLQFAWQKLQRLAKKHQKIASLPAKVEMANGPVTALVNSILSNCD